jgi:hypothetical protein
MRRSLRQDHLRFSLELLSISSLNGKGGQNLGLQYGRKRSSYETGPYSSSRWTQRYYKSSVHFQGPGSPNFVVLGGESGIEPSTDFFSPFIADTLAEAFGAFVLEPEH